MQKISYIYFFQNNILGISTQECQRAEPSQFLVLSQQKLGQKIKVQLELTARNLSSRAGSIFFYFFWFFLPLNCLFGNCLFVAAKQAAIKMSIELSQPATNLLPVGNRLAAIKQLYATLRQQIEFLSLFCSFFILTGWPHSSRLPKMGLGLSLGLVPSSLELGRLGPCPDRATSDSSRRAQLQSLYRPHFKKYIAQKSM